MKIYEELSELIDNLQEIIGFNGMLLSGSKSGYRNANPRNLVIFNSNIFLSFPDEEQQPQFVKIWWGDLDLTKSFSKLRPFVQNWISNLPIDATFYVLYEMDGRFELESNPRVDNYVVSINKDCVNFGKYVNLEDYDLD